MSAPRSGAGVADVACVACGARMLTHRFDVAGHPIYACGACGTTHVRPLPDRETLHDYYDHAYSLAREARAADVLAKAAAYHDTARIVGLVRRLAPGARRVVEVGCSYGYLLWGLRESGYEVEGYELSQTTAGVGREALGLAIHETDRPAPDAPRADVLIMRHVLEHALDPGAMLERFGALLAPGGLLLLATPNVGSLACRWFGADWEWMAPPAHLHLFARKGLDRLLRSAGFAPVWWETRRGDARPFAIQLARAATARAGVKDALTSRYGNLIPDAAGATTNGGGGLKRTLLGTAAALDRLAFPLVWLVARAGAAEELWVAAHRGRA